MKQPKQRWTIRGLKAVILIVTLWVAVGGSPVPGHALIIVTPYEISGWVDPNKALTDVYVIVGNNYYARATSIVSNSFDFTVYLPFFNPPTNYTVMGLYDTTNDYVTIALNSAAYTSGGANGWSALFGTSESTVGGWLATGDISDLANFFTTYISSFPDLGTACSLMNFSGGTPGGMAFATVVPLPPSLLLLGSGLLSLVGWRRVK